MLKLIGCQLFSKKPVPKIFVGLVRVEGETTADLLVYS